MYDSIIYVCIILLMLLITLSIVLKTIINGISPMPTNMYMRQAVLHEIKKYSIKKTIVDAGSGFGHLIYHLAADQPQHHYVGIENSYIPYLFATIKNKVTYKKSRGSISFLHKNMHHVDFNHVDVLICYLHPNGMQRLYHTLKKQNINITVISVAFAINLVKPVRIITCNDVYRTKVYTYHIKGNID